MMDDPELQEIFTDPAHQEVVDLLKASRPATPPLDPHFRSYLRAKLMTEAQRTLGPRASRSWLPFSLSPKALAPAMAAVAAGFIVVLGVEVYLHNQAAPANPVAVRLVNDHTNVATVEPIVLRFSGPVDKTAIEESVQIEPATSVTKTWNGNTLVIVPNHQLAPNTTYTVTLKPQAVATPNPASPTSTPKAVVVATPVAVRFTTTPAPVPPAVPPSFKSSTVNWRHDDRLPNSNAMLNASWTPAGQLLVTRPAGQPGPAASASASPASSAGGSTTDIWLMSAKGTPLRDLAPGATLPSAAPTGGLFASWNVISSNQASLQIRDLQGNLISTVATVSGIPDRPAVWLGSDRVAFVDNGTLRVVGLHTPVSLPALTVDHGSLAGSADGQLLALESTGGSLVIDLATGASRATLPRGATGFAWSSKGDLAFVVPNAAGTNLYLFTNGRSTEIASSASGQTWSDLNWAPDANSLLLATRSSAAGSLASLLLINADGSHPTAFGSPQQEYTSPQWSPAGDLVLFTRRDDATGAREFWTATAMASASDAAEQQALAEFNTFMQARLRGDSSAALAELDDAGRAAYQAGGLALLSSSGSQFDRYYPITVQLQSTNPNRFLIGVRIFIAKAGVETSFVEEQLTLVQQSQKYLIDAATATPIVPVGHGPTVVSVQLVQTPSREEVRVRFDADLNASTISQGTIKVKDAQGNDVAERVTFDPDNHLATITAELPPGTYQLVVTTGLTDINGVAMAQEYDAPLLISSR
jgi:Bacterial Ig-like domain